MNEELEVCYPMVNGFNCPKDERGELRCCLNLCLEVDGDDLWDGWLIINHVLPRGLGERPRRCTPVDHDSPSGRRLADTRRTAQYNLLPRRHLQTCGIAAVCILLHVRVNAWTGTRSLLFAPVSSSHIEARSHVHSLHPMLSVTPAVYTIPTSHSHLHTNLDLSVATTTITTGH